MLERYDDLGFAVIISAKHRKWLSTEGLRSGEIESVHVHAFSRYGFTAMHKRKGERVFLYSRIVYTLWHSNYVSVISDSTTLCKIPCPIILCT